MATVGSALNRAQRRQQDDRLFAPVPLSAAGTSPQTAECARCEASVVLVLGQLPPGWRLKGGQATCSDCLRGASPLQPVVPAAANGPARHTPHRYRGCRISHEIALGMAAIQIRAGATPPEGRDERVQFLLDVPAIEQLIVELGTIRAEITGQLS